MNPLTKFAAILMFAAALCQLSITVLSGFSSTSLPLFFAVLSTVLGLIVLNNKRWAMWPGFFVMLAGGIAGMAMFLSGAVSPNWASLGVWVVSWTAAACLFFLLWRDHVPDLGGPLGKLGN